MFLSDDDPIVYEHFLPFSVLIVELSLIGVRQLTSRLEKRVLVTYRLRVASDTELGDLVGPGLAHDRLSAELESVLGLQAALTSLVFGNTTTA